MITPINEVGVPEVCCHSRQTIEGGTVIRFLERQPGERKWQAVRLFKPDTFTCTQCGEVWPRDRMSNPDGTGPLCPPCLCPHAS